MKLHGEERTSHTVQRLYESEVALWWKRTSYAHIHGSFALDYLTVTYIIVKELNLIYNTTYVLFFVATKD